MCLQIPLKVSSVEGEKVTVENGRVLLKHSQQSIKRGDYVLSFGNIVVNRLAAEEAKKIRKTLK